MTASLFSLQGQTALVTGGAKGIGKGIVSVLRQAGANVVIADIDREQGQATAKELGAHYQHTDVRVQQSCQDAVPPSSNVLARSTSFAPIPASSRRRNWPT